MITKYLTVLFAAIVLVQAASLKDDAATTAAATTANSCSTTENPKDEATELYNELNEKVEEGLSAGKIALEQVTGSVITFTSNSTKDIEEMFTQYSNEFAKINKQYADLGTNISKCIEKVVPILKNQRHYSLDHIQKNVTYQVDAVQNYYNFPAIKNVEKLSRIVYSLGVELKNCHKDAECIENVLDSLEDESDVIPTQVDKYILSFDEYLSNYTIFTEDAIDEIPTQYESIRNNAVESVIACAEDLVAL